MTCDIEAIADVDTFRFGGTAGESVSVRTGTVALLTPCIDLYEPDGTQVATDCDFGGGGED